MPKEKMYKNITQIKILWQDLKNNMDIIFIFT